MIYITGDVHGDIVERFNPVMMPGEDRWDENDILIVTGDFGLIMYPRIDLYADKIAQEKKKIEYLEKKPYTVLFCDGNHENFDRLLTEFPEEERYGGTVKRIARNVFWLRRSQVYTVSGASFFVFGGAYSPDKAKRTADDKMISDRFGCPDRHFTWWPQELPAKEEYDAATANLQARGMRVDYILTHTAPQTLIQFMKKWPDDHDRELTGYLDWIYHEVSFRRWYFGHFHDDAELEAFGKKATMLYFNTVPLDDGRTAGTDG